MAKSFAKVYSGTQEGQRLQQNIEDAIAKLLRNPILDGRIFEQAVVSGSNKIEHKLNRKIQGYIVVKKNANITIYDTEDDNLFLTLQCSGAATISILVF